MSSVTRGLALAVAALLGGCVVGDNIPDELPDVGAVDAGCLPPPHADAREVECSYLCESGSPLRCRALSGEEVPVEWCVSDCIFGHETPYPPGYCPGANYPPR